MKTTKTILISGASIAGPALAFWLHKYGFDVTIVEQAPAIRPGGYAVDFRGVALSVLKEMELLEEIKKFETRAGKINIVDKHNAKVGSFPDAFTSGELEIMRGDLANILYEATRENVRYIFNDSITSLTEHNDCVTVTFKQQLPCDFDLVIGADGLHSKVRTIAFGSEAKCVSHLGLYVAIFTTPDFLKLNMDGVFYSTLGKRVGVFGAKEGTEARASFYFADKDIPYNYRDISQQKQIVREKFAREEWKVPALLEMMDNAPDFYFDAISQVKIDSWSKGRVALLGDAAHCASPMSGMGTSLAVLGAYILAGELKEANGDYQQAFASYETQLRPMAERCQQMADGAEWFVPSTWLKYWMSQLMWKILPYTPWKNMMIEMPNRIANSITLKQYA
ncbi:FAD-dependent monooxygenase [Chitinophaga sp. Cy-1792]|uniref:FAD-dependent monooxygenase n=1 Tax=Chitinophaga sp. Cy-1792 TaxID=2608339 RepID=UPI00141DE4B6|nr:FAD-dependent monooxygenase [Chitinophaga sp. Cy-1792]NIG54346.1 FAD-dependent oxidoreductase [Chitinophaga sp. Cy-1792]